MNKFLKQYPQLWTPKVGDKIRIIKVLNEHREIITKDQYERMGYAIGFIGIIIVVPPNNILNIDNTYTIDFEINGHTFADTNEDEISYAFREEFELAE